ncbi:MAG: hypothetical protein LBU48_01215 [Coriobacteriales bacterium]|jgi:hypothetical protein|nr:hypothetical protein [Coriobacteriales bacterium]
MSEQLEIRAQSDAKALQEHSRLVRALRTPLNLSPFTIGLIVLLVTLAFVVTILAVQALTSGGDRPLLRDIEQLDALSLVVDPAQNPTADTMDVEGNKLSVEAWSVTGKNGVEYRVFELDGR